MCAGVAPPPAAPVRDTPSAAASLDADAGRGGFEDGQDASLDGLVSRPELTGSLVTVLSFDAASARWAVKIARTGETIRVKAD